MLMVMHKTLTSGTVLSVVGFELGHRSGISESQCGPFYQSELSTSLSAMIPRLSRSAGLESV